MDSRPIGVFDSGLGGLTVVRALQRQLPREDLIYLGDTARVPYGTRSPQTVIRYARACAYELVSRQVKCIVIACNTVSAVAVDHLRAEHDMPVLGVVAPGAQAAVKQVKSLESGQGLKIGVLGTRGTIASGAYPRAVAQQTSRYEVVAQPAPLLVPLVEEGWLSGEVPHAVVAQYLTPLLAQGVAVIVLGCTHYPLLEPVVRAVAEEIAGHPIPVVDSALATAEAIEELFIKEQLQRSSRETPGKLELLVTDQPGGFAEVAELFLGKIQTDITQVDLKPVADPSAS